jgi:hypothetical protein
VTDHFGHRHGLMFWLEPVIMLVGGAAVWRMGSVLRVQDASQGPTGNVPDSQQA